MKRREKEKRLPSKSGPLKSKLYKGPREIPLFPPNNLSQGMVPIPEKGARLKDVQFCDVI